MQVLCIYTYLFTTCFSIKKLQTLAKSNKTTERINFASSQQRFSYPDFLDIQIPNLFKEFFQLKLHQKIELMKDF